MTPPSCDPTLPERCPRCASVETRALFWGLPVELPDPALYLLAGCVVRGEPETFACLSCETRW